MSVVLSNGTFLEVETTSNVISISVGIAGIVLSIITAVISSFITYYCCIKTKAHYSISHTNTLAVAEYETPVSTTTSGKGVLELKDNMAYGQVVTTNRQANTTNAPIVYESVQS